MTDPTTPTTEAGCALLETIAIAERLSPNGVRVRNYIPPILAIEAEAARQERARLAEAVEKRGHRFVALPALCEHRWANRQVVHVSCEAAAVLALLSEETPHE